jgi:hypothetical protein
MLTCTSSGNTTPEHKFLHVPVRRVLCCSLPHTLPIAYWGAVGAVALSVPTPEYFKSFGWSATPVVTKSSSVISPSMAPPHPLCVATTTNVRNGSTFRAAGLKVATSAAPFLRLSFDNYVKGARTVIRETAAGTDTDAARRRRWNAGRI